MVSGRFANHLLLDCLSCRLPLTLLAAIAIWLFCWAGSSNLGAGSLIRFQQLNSLVHLPWTTFKLNCFCVLYFFFPSQSAQVGVDPGQLHGDTAFSFSRLLTNPPALLCPFSIILHSHMLCTFCLNGLHVLREHHDVQHVQSQGQMNGFPLEVYCAIWGTWEDNAAKTPPSLTHSKEKFVPLCLSLC